MVIHRILAHPLQVNRTDTWPDCKTKLKRRGELHGWSGMLTVTLIGERERRDMEEIVALLGAGS